MSLNHQESPSFDNNNIGQSPGCDPKTQTKRNSGLFGFLKWFKPTAASSRESIDNDLQNSQSSSCDSLNSTLSNGTVASFSYINPNNYLNNNRIPNKCIILGPETDTYKARLKQRDKRRENDKNLTLRKKYNLFFNRETLLKTVKQQEEENSRSLPLIMTRTMDEEQQQQKAHRRTNSESSKTKKAGAYLHVKGKRKAPQPPGFKTNTDTMSLRRKKRLAPPPPPANLEKIIKQELQVEIISNDSLKLDHGILKPVKETCSPDQNNITTNSPETTTTTSARSSLVEAPVSPRPWYKRTQTTNKTTNDNKYEPIERLPDVQFTRNSIIDLTTATDESANLSKKKHDEKRKSGMSFLTNISELDREATEIIKKEQQKSSTTTTTTTTTGNNVQEMPQFMRPKDEPKINTDSWVSPKRRSAKDLIAKFNAITNVTKVTVFGQSKDTKRDYFGRKSDDNKKQENLLESHRKRLEQIDQKKQSNQPALMKSESTSAIKPKNDTPKFERKSWNCPKCLAENEYWRIICHVCSTIKPYFDDLDTPSPKKEEDKVVEKPTISQTSPDKILERSKTQIGFSALANYNRNKKIEKAVSIDEKTTTKETENKNEERERLKKMLIEMKNSLPNRKSNILLKQNSRTSVIVENPDNDEEEPKTPEEPSKIAEILVGTSETIYENIKVKRTDNPKPIKVSSSAQTQITKTAQNAEPSKSILKKTEDVKKPLEQAIKIDPPVVLKSDPKPNNFELMRPKDFESIYSDPNGQSPARIYANLARNDELSLFFNMPKQFNQIKTSLSQNNRTTDTIEVNRLLKRLESAIAKGELVEASNYAKELAQLKVNCSVIRQKPSTTTPKKQGFTIEMYVEDKISHRGPFPIEVTSNQTVAELKQQVEEEFEIPVNVQRWILGKELASDDRATLKDHNITTEGCPVFLYLVAPDIKSTKVEKTEQGPSTSKTPDQISPAKLDHVPKIVEVIPKVVDTPQKLEINKVVAKDSKTETKVSEVKISIENKRKSFLEASITDATPSSSSAVVVDVKPTVLDEDSDDYDSKTLKPEPKVAKEWECHLCTLLNPVTSNICAVCATVRQKEHQLKAPKKSVKKHAPQPQEATYLQLVNLDNTDLVENTESFECLICFLLIEKGQGVTLRECLHQFCKTCLAYTIEYNEDAEIKCPYRDEQYSCNIALQDREIKALVTPQIYEQYLAKSMKEAENKIGKSFHCKTPDCHGWCIFEDNVNEFRCPVCRRINCLTCQAIHTGMNCKQYQERMNQASEIDEDAKRTKEMVDEMVRKGEALTCPTCQVILMKKWGCDWVRCSMCKTEICWVTKGPRWGPGGKGDTSGGCQCGVNGVKCHPQCNYCH